MLTLWICTQNSSRPLIPTHCYLSHLKMQEEMDRGREEHQMRGAGPLKKRVALTGNNIANQVREE